MKKQNTKDINLNGKKYSDKELYIRLEQSNLAFRFFLEQIKSVIDEIEKIKTRCAKCDGAKLEEHTMACKDITKVKELLKQRFNI